MIKVSIILTVFERSEFLVQCISSVLNQTYHNFEIIIADDSNSSKIQAICKSFESKQIKYIGNTETLGVTFNIKKAISICTGEYISILNDDDYRDVMFLEKLVTILTNHIHIDIIFSDHWIVDENGTTIKNLTETICQKHGRKNLKNGIVNDLRKLVVIHNGLPIAMSSIIRKSCIDPSKFIIDIGGSYDLWISYFLAKENVNAWYVSERLSYYRIHDKMETQKKSINKSTPKIHILNEALNWFPEYKYLLLKRKSKLLYDIGKDCIFFGKNKEAFSYFKTSIQLNYNLKAFVLLIYSLLPSKITLQINNQFYKQI